MFRHIMIPFDGSPGALDAVHIARHLAKRMGASLTLVHVDSDIPIGREPNAVALQMSMLLRQMRRQGINVEMQVEIGSPPEILVAVARTLHIDLLVLAPKHRGMLTRMLPMGVTEHLLVHAPAPLLVWPDRADSHGAQPFQLLGSPAGLVVCPLDGSAVAERALPLAIALAHEYARTLVLARVVQPIQALGSEPAATYLIREAQRDEEQAAIHYVQGMRHRVRQEADVSVEAMLLIGHPAEEILGLSVAHEGSAIVMSTHGRGGWSRVFVGSVAADVIRRSVVPLLVVPPPSAFDETTGGSETGM